MPVPGLRMGSIWQSALQMEMFPSGFDSLLYSSSTSGIVDIRFWSALKTRKGINQWVLHARL